MSLPRQQFLSAFQMDKSMQEKNFIRNQSQYNELIKKNQKNINFFNEAQQLVGVSTTNLPEIQKLKFNDVAVGSKLQSKMLEDQMRLKNLEEEHDLKKSRIQDVNNANTFRKKYPFGKENLKITEDVIQKYSINNYLVQKDILKKFQQQAKLRKQQQKLQKNQINQKRLADYSQINHITSINNQNQMIRKKQNRSSRKKQSILSKQMNKLQEAKKKYIISLQKSQPSRQKENKKLESIQSMLKDIKNTLDQNLSTLTNRSNYSQREDNFIEWTDILKDRLQKLNELQRKQDCYRRKIPVVIYNEMRNQKNNYFNKVLCRQIQSYERKQSINKPEKYDQVLRIYHLNKKRLDQLSEKITIRENRSIF